MALFTHIFFLPRFLLGWGAYMLCAFIAIVTCIGEDLDRPESIPLWKVNLVRCVSNIGMQFAVLVSCGIWSNR